MALVFLAIATAAMRVSLIAPRFGEQVAYVVGTLVFCAEILLLSLPS